MHLMPSDCAEWRKFNSSHFERGLLKLSTPIVRRVDHFFPAFDLFSVVDLCLSWKDRELRFSCGDVLIDARKRTCVGRPGPAVVEG